MVGLFLIAFGTGGIKPCVSAFGGDQFIRPQQDKQLEQFFSVFYFAINAGSLISTFVTPILREDVHCFGEDSCFSLAFGLPAALMLVAIGIHNLYLIIRLCVKQTIILLFLNIISCFHNRKTIVQDQATRRQHYHRFLQVHWGILKNGLKYI